MIAASERDSLIDQVTAIVRRSAKVPGKIAIGPESRLVEDLAIDSLDLVSLVLSVQDHFDVVFDEDAVPNLCRVADIVEYLEARREDTGCNGAGMVRNGGPYGSRGDAGRFSEAAGRAVVA